LIAPPNYVISANTLKKNDAFELIKKALDQIEIVIKEKNGKYKLQQEARIIGEKIDRELEMKFKELEKEQDSSDDDDEDVEGMGINTQYDKELDAVQQSQNELSAGAKIN